MNQNSDVIKHNIWVFLGFAAFGPTISAFSTMSIIYGTVGAKQLIQRCHYKLIPTKWFIFSIFSMPVFLAPTSFIVTLLLSTPVGSLGEEFGWRGILVPMVQDILDSWVESWVENQEATKEDVKNSFISGGQTNNFQTPQWK